MQHHKEIKSHAEHVSNIKPFIDLLNWNGIKYPTLIVNSNYTLFESKNLEIPLVVLYVSVDIKPFIEKGGVSVCVYKSIEQSSMSKHQTTVI